jgi:hypothetical protein
MMKFRPDRSAVRGQQRERFAPQWCDGPEVPLVQRQQPGRLVPVSQHHERLIEYAPVQAVLGNNNGPGVAAETLEPDLAGLPSRSCPARGAAAAVRVAQISSRS